MYTPPPPFPRDLRQWVQQNQTTHTNCVCTEFTSPLFKCFYRRGGSKISYHLLVICITIRGTHVFANCDIFWEWPTNEQISHLVRTVFRLLHAVSLLDLGYHLPAVHAGVGDPPQRVDLIKHHAEWPPGEWTSGRGKTNSYIISIKCIF